MPQLVEENIFQSVAEQLDENRRRNRQGRRGAKYLLQGLLACGCCGYAYYGKPVSSAGRKAEFEPRITTAKERLARLQIELKSQVDQEAQARDLRLVVDTLATFARQIAAGLDQADWNAKRDKNG